MGIYLDHAATTACDERVLQEMLPWFTENFGNPSTSYGPGQKSAGAVRTAREQIAGMLHTVPSQIFFTSGGSEADNWALKGMDKGHIITTNMEHPAVLQSCAYLEKKGFAITYLEVNPEGLITPEQVANAIGKDTVLVSVMYANNEIGTVQPISEIAGICHEKGVLLHTDAVQAFGQLPIDVEKEGIDLLSASGHKIYGPKGIGMLYIRQGIPMGSFIHGGAQERGRRAGTENVPGIVGFGKAAELAVLEMEERAAKEKSLRDYLLQQLQEKLQALGGEVHINGTMDSRLPGNLNITIPGLRAETAMINLDFKGICVSAGSACSTGSLSPSHVLKAIGLSDEEARQSLRITIGKENTKEDMLITAETIAELYARSNKM